MDTKPILQALLNERELVKQHIDSYNDFIEHRLQDIVDETAGIETETGYQVNFGKIKIHKAEVIEAEGSKNNITPLEARLRNLSYFSPLELEMTPVKEGKVGRTELINIGMLPTMLRSQICNLHGKSRKELIQSGEDPLDPGVYFIVNGS